MELVGGQDWHHQIRGVQNGGLPPQIRRKGKVLPNDVAPQALFPYWLHDSQYHNLPWEADKSSAQESWEQQGLDHHAVPRYNRLLSTQLGHWWKEPAQQLALSVLLANLIAAFRLMCQTCWWKKDVDRRFPICNSIDSNRPMHHETQQQEVRNQDEAVDR